MTLSSDLLESHAANRCIARHVEIVLEGSTGPVHDLSASGYCQNPNPAQTTLFAPVAAGFAVLPRAAAVAFAAAAGAGGSWTVRSCELKEDWSHEGQYLWFSGRSGEVHNLSHHEEMLMHSRDASASAVGS
jgi:hypothetical protein